MKTKLEIKSISFPIFLGIEPDEKENPQNILFDITITFNQTPEACLTDNFENAICYKNLAESLQDFCANRHFDLIENLAYSAFKFIKDNFIKNQGKLMVKVSKNPPTSLIGFSCFSIEE